MTDTEIDPDLDRALAWVDRQIIQRHQELALLGQVRTQLRSIIGAQQPDGWAQIGSRSGEEQ